MITATEQLESLNAERGRMAARIVRNPTKFKVCCKCDSLLHASSGLCPQCHGYRFETEPGLVQAQARLLSERDFITSNPYILRTQCLNPTNN